MNWSAARPSRCTPTNATESPPTKRCTSSTQLGAGLRTSRVESCRPPMTASEASAHATIPPARAVYHHVCERTAAAYGSERSAAACRGVRRRRRSCRSPTLVASRMAAGASPGSADAGVARAPPARPRPGRPRPHAGGVGCARAGAQVRGGDGPGDRRRTRRCSARRAASGWPPPGDGRRARPRSAVAPAAGVAPPLGPLELGAPAAAARGVTTGRRAALLEPPDPLGRVDVVACGQSSDRCPPARGARALGAVGTVC